MCLKGVRSSRMLCLAAPGHGSRTGWCHGEMLVDVPCMCCSIQRQSGTTQLAYHPEAWTVLPCIEGSQRCACNSLIA